MNNEIKEILDELKDEDMYIEDYGYQYKRISLKETKQLLDYITNLQQDYDKAMELVNEGVENSYKKLKYLQQENERLKYQLNQEKPNYLQIWQLEDRIYEASEFIKEKISSTKGVIDDYMYHKEHNQHLIELLNEDIEMYKNELNILQGENKQ